MSFCKCDHDYTKDNICAVVVSYNPDPTFERNIKSLIKQVGGVVVVDNGSSNHSFVDSVVKENGASIIDLHDNLGIACALNKGLEYCKTNGFELVLTMDQDTVLGERTVQALLDAILKYDIQSAGINWDGSCKKDTLVNYLITSGNLFVLEAALLVNGYDENLFIDSVDFDFSLKLKEKGFRMMKVADALAEHNLGELQEGSNYRTHSAERYYYIYRNHFYIVKKYWKGNKSFCIKKQLALIYDLGKTIMFDKERQKKLAALKNGYRDARLLTKGL